MPRITYQQPDGSRLSIDVEAGANVMRTAIANDVPGIVAECGGAAMCATCHVYVDPEFARALPPINEVEEEMLEGTAAERLPTSRLGCQLAMPAGLAELVVRVPSAQL
jgi:2Fe-2S ferredoxin